MEKYIFKNITLGLGILIFVGCGTFGTIIKMQEMNKVPDGQYERIIKLNNPEGPTNETLAGLVFIKKGASICTDYPRQEIIKSVDELSVMEKIAYKYSKSYTIKEDGKIYGFVSEPAEYMVTFWKNEKDENCKYKVQFTLISKDNNDGGGFDDGHRGHVGGYGR